MLVRRKKMFIFLAVLAAVFAGTGYAINKFMTGPATGTVITTLPAVAKPAEVELQQFDGKQFSFVHPVAYVEQAVKPEPTAIELRSFVSSGMARKLANVTVKQLPSGSLEDDPSYLMRSQNPDTYRMQSIVVKNEKVVFFLDTAGQEFQQIAFWAHKDKLLTFVLTGAAIDPAAMAAEHEAMVKSISWH
ncbi:MAG TPA: hypothetical protein VK978_03045 [Candidatus Saccharimonadales bacterium]|nr:hypothetical protein [Candidatus Saccharimonadales bacterium]